MITLPPFKSFLASNIPSVYDNTLSYYDELTKLIAYLEQVVVPAVNETAGQVDGIKKGLEELKSYVDHYFDNLDVQEEINNKLDDMAESGELQTIIAQFLELAPVFGYDTIAAMAAADNLADGCIARVLGNTAAADGNGAYYKVRTKVEGDDPDGYTLVAIGDDLVADRIVNADVEAVSAALTTTNIKLNKVSNIVSNQAGLYLGTFFDSTSTTLRIVASHDGYNFTRILPSFAPSIRDPQLSYIDGKFYIVATQSGSNSYDGRIYVSTDLINWTNTTFSMGLTQFDQKWAPEIFVDTDDKIYFTVSAGTVSAKSLYIAECTDLENLTFTGLRQLYPGGTATVSIDSSIAKKGSVYYLSWSEQGTADDGTSKSTCKIASSIDLTNWTTINSNVFTEFQFVEGMQIVPVNDRFILLGDATTSHHYYVFKEVTDLAQTSGVYGGHIQNPTSLMFMRHGSITYITNENALNTIASATASENINAVNNIFNNFPTTVLLSGNITNLVVEPNTTYRISDTTTITNLLNPYRLGRVSFVFATATNRTLTITNIQSGEGTIATRNRSMSNSADLNEKMFDLSLSGNCYWYK